MNQDDNDVITIDNITLLPDVDRCFPDEGVSCGSFESNGAAMESGDKLIKIVGFTEAVSDPLFVPLPTDAALVEFSFIGDPMDVEAFFVLQRCSILDNESTPAQIPGSSCLITNFTID